MRLLLVAGGTGSLNLQIGLAGAGISYEVLVNAYDDGLSTGFVRRVAGCLGPSDLRKNLHTQLALAESRSPYLGSLVCRFSAWSAYEAAAFAFTKCRMPLAMMEGLQTWFEIVGSQERYDDVSLANLAMAGIFHQVRSMQMTTDVMAHALGLEPSIHLNSDENLHLFARSRSGRYASEGELVRWNQPEDPLEAIEFRRDGVAVPPPRLSDRAREAIERADAVVIAPGTIFSSLLPTILTDGFAEATEGRPIVVVENLQPDADVAGYEPEQALGLLLEPLHGLDVRVVQRVTLRSSGPFHDPAELSHAVRRCLN